MYFQFPYLCSYYLSILHLQDVKREFSSAVLAHEEYMMLLDTEDIEYNDDWINELGEVVAECFLILDGMINEQSTGG